MQLTSAKLVKNGHLCLYAVYNNIVKTEIKKTTIETTRYLEMYIPGVPTT